MGWRRYYHPSCYTTPDVVVSTWRKSGYCKNKAENKDKNLVSRHWSGSWRVRYCTSSHVCQWTVYFHMLFLQYGQSFQFGHLCTLALGVWTIPIRRLWIDWLLLKVGDCWHPQEHNIKNIIICTNHSCQHMVFKSALDTVLQPLGSPCYTVLASSKW